jgi:hypothetical protein
MRPIILNREFQHPADGWYQIETPGKHLNTEAGVLQVIDDTAVNSIVNRFNQEADDYKQKNGKPFPGMVIDHEHFKHQADKETRAYGWLMRLENRGGIPFGQIDWTNTGKPAIDGGDYRYFSTEYDPRDLVVLNKGQKPMRIRPMRLDGLSLTNAPNNIGGAPITNRLKNGAIAIPKHHNFDSDEEYLAAAKKNQQTIATNIEAERIASERSEAAHLGNAAEFSLPDLEKWFRAVKNIREIALQNSDTNLDFGQAWNLAREQHPEIYKAAFGAAEQSNAPDATDIESASAQVAALANRIANITRGDFRFGWNFVRDNLPAVYNRALTLSEAILNRAKESKDPQAVQEKAAHLFNQFVSAEQASSGLPASQAWSRVANRHPALTKLAAGSLTLEEACEQDPELRTRL